MLRRASLPSRAFNNSKRDRRLSTPSSAPPLPSPRQSTRGFVTVKVADFVTVPNDRLSQPRNALGPVDLAKRPPCYDLRPTVTSEHHDPPHPPDHVFEISDRHHMETLRTILTSSRDSSSDEAESIPEPESVAPLEPAAAPESVADAESVAENADQNPKERLCEEHVEEPLEKQTRMNSETIENSETHHHQDDSDQELTDKYDDLREYDESDIEEQIDPDLDFDKDKTSASFIIASISTEDTTVTSMALSTSSVEDTSLSEFPTITSINTTDGTSESLSSVQLEDDHPSVFVAVESSECLVDKKKALPSFMRRKVPSPVKYTFRPLHKVPSSLENRRESNEVTTIVPSEYPPRLTADIACNSDVSSDDSNSHEQTSSMKPPTLSAVKKVVDKIDPHAAIGIAHVPPLALATVSFFRKKRDSEESIWSRKSDANGRKKRESDESTQSSNTEYYEDDYTKFIEKKNSTPRSPLRLRNHPYFAKIVNPDDGLKFSRSGFRRSSSVSVSTSDEEYNPLSSVTHSSNVSRMRSA